MPGLNVEFNREPPTEGNLVSCAKPYWIHRWNEIFAGKDDEDFLYKSTIMTKYTGGFALALASGEIIFNDLRGVKAARVALRWAVPLIGGGLAYTSAVAFMGGIRKKTEIKHHFIAGQFIVGSVVGASRKCIGTGFIWGFITGVIGGVYKASKLEGWELFRPWEFREVGYSWSHKRDLTWFKEYPGYWVREAPKEEECD